MNTSLLCRVLFALGILIPHIAAAAEYNPLALPASANIKSIDLAVNDAARKREIPVRVYLPMATTAAPVVLFSHGLGGAKENSPYLGKHWAGRGYIVVFMQHHGSDVAVWKDQPLLKKMAAMREAASAENFVLRVQDVPAVIDQLEKWHVDSGHPLHGRLDLKRVGMSGHSFGAVTTQAVSGQSFPLIGAKYTDPRIIAAIAFSPSAPRRGSSEQTFGSVKIPWLLMTGTKDDSPIGNTTPESRREVFKGISPGQKYELVLFNAEHAAFSERALPGEREARNPNHHKLILALSTAFWDAYLRGNKDALAWLDGEGAKSLLEKVDIWQRK